MRLHSAAGSLAISGAFFLLASATVVRANPTADQCISSEIFNEYRRYQIALANDVASVPQFFSRHVIEVWVGYVLRPRKKSAQDVVIAAFRNRFRYGDLIQNVIHCSIRDQTERSGTLELYYQGKSSLPSGKPRKLSISYVIENGAWRIDQLDFKLPESEPHGSGDSALTGLDDTRE